MDIVNIIITVVSFCVGMLVHYLTAYNKKKGENKALLEDLSKLEDEKQKIISFHQKELEEVRKEHSLDIEKRKYQYETKREQFTRFFRLIDEFQKKSTENIVMEFKPILERFMAAAMDADGEISKEIMISYQNDIYRLMNEAHDDLSKLNQETNSIRLVSSKEIDTLLNNMELVTRESTEFACDMIKFMSTEEYLADNSTILPLLQKSQEQGQEIHQIRQQLQAQMKLELDEI